MLKPFKLSIRNLDVADLVGFSEKSNNLEKETWLGGRGPEGEEGVPIRKLEVAIFEELSIF